jgi:Flagella basal body rod protein
MMQAALSGLRAADTLFAAQADNIANVNTPGYRARRVELAEARPSGGVLVEAVRTAPASETAGLEGESQTDLAVEIPGTVVSSAMYSANLAVSAPRTRWPAPCSTCAPDTASALPLGRMSGAPETRQALLAALREIRPQLGGLVRRARAAAPATGLTHYDDPAIEQFANAVEALLVEALEEAGTEHRTLVFETAIPGVVAQGYPAMSMLEDHVALFLLLSTRLVAAVPAEQRTAAEDWLARYCAAYVHETTVLALAAEGKPA